MKLLLHSEEFAKNKSNQKEKTVRASKTQWDFKLTTHSMSTAEAHTGHTTERSLLIHTIHFYRLGLVECCTYLRIVPSPRVILLDTVTEWHHSTSPPNLMNSSFSTNFFVCKEMSVWPWVQWRFVHWFHRWNVQSADRCVQQSHPWPVRWFSLTCRWIPRGQSCLCAWWRCVGMAYSHIQIQRCD